MKNIKTIKNKQGFVKKPTKLALGEVTGHSHQILEPVMVKENKNGLADELLIEKKVDLVHEEHEKVVLDVDEYTVVRQRELNLLGKIQSVLD